MRGLLKIKELSNKKWIYGLFIHIVILWISLALSYNSYTEFMKMIEPLERAIRYSIKATFPWTILSFSVIYLFFAIRKKVGNVYLNFREYVSVIILYSTILNLLIFTKGKDVLIPLNISVLYFVVFLSIFLRVSQCSVISNIKDSFKAEDWLPPIIYKLFTGHFPRIKAYVKGRPSSPFIIAFMVVLIICALCLVSKREQRAEELGSIGYFLLVIGVGIELYQMIRYKSNT